MRTRMHCLMHYIILYIINKCTIFLYYIIKLYFILSTSAQTEKIQAQGRANRKRRGRGRNDSKIKSRAVAGRSQRAQAPARPRTRPWTTAFIQEKQSSAGRGGSAPPARSKAGAAEISQERQNLPSQHGTTQMTPGRRIAQLARRGAARCGTVSGCVLSLK